MTDAPFSLEIYRQWNHDLRELDDESLTRHFLASQDQRRVYGPTATTAELMSMRWLRGEGVEIGAGGDPVRLFGAAKSIDLDVDESQMFHGSGFKTIPPIDDPAFPSAAAGRFDFAIASHVLEHCDSVLRALENLCAVTKPGGVVYLVLPDINGLHDYFWMKRYDFAHHVEEYSEPLKYALEHDNAHIDALFAGDHGEPWDNEHATFSDEYHAALRARSIPPHLRYMHHKHNYDFGGWISLIEKAREFLGCYRILDCRFGPERLDCHFALEPLPKAPPPRPSLQAPPSLPRRALRKLARVSARMLSR